VSTFSLSNSPATTHSFPTLAIVYEDFFFTHNSAVTAEFNVLSTIVGDFVVSYNTLLISLRMTALKSIGGSISIMANHPWLAMLFSPLYQLYCEQAATAVVIDLQSCTHHRSI
jgi:hypothetical protein